MTTIKKQSMNFTFNILNNCIACSCLRSSLRNRIYLTQLVAICKRLTLCAYKRVFTLDFSEVRCFGDLEQVFQLVLNRELNLDL